MKESNLHLNELLVLASNKGASDVHLSAGRMPMIRINGELEILSDRVLTADETDCYAKDILTEVQLKHLVDEGQVDIAIKMGTDFIYRVNVFIFDGLIGLACRIITSEIPKLAHLGLPMGIEKVLEMRSGLVLVTGPTGCGKSTTLAAIIEQINASRRCHIITLEDPIEYIHKNKKSIVTQREVGRDCKSFSDALRAGLRQDPDVIMVGEMRDLETISTAITAAETGHLVLATLHTRNAFQTIERIIDVFPATHQRQIRYQLANTLMAVFCQNLLPNKNNDGRVVAVESLLVTSAIRNLIRENKVHQLLSFIQTGHKFGMQTMDSSLLELYQNRLISRTTLLEHASDQELIFKTIN